MSLRNVFRFQFLRKTKFGVCDGTCIAKALAQKAEEILKGPNPDFKLAAQLYSMAEGATLLAAAESKTCADLHRKDAEQYGSRADALWIFAP